MSNLLGVYKNGNYITTIYSDGTKVRATGDEEFNPDFAENCNVCITRKCDGGCKYCYEGCTPDGKHADLLSQEWVHSLHPYTEVTIDGNDLSHPQLQWLLWELRDKKVIANITVNQKHFMKNAVKLRQWQENGFIHGVGISLVHPDDDFIKAVKAFPNAVIHVINGIVTKNQMEMIADNDLKILILGYKDLRRGHDYKLRNLVEIVQNKSILYNNLLDYIKRFKAINFDNLALEQLDVKYLVTESVWEQICMGDDSDYTFYIDAVEQKFAKDSVASDDERYDLLDTVDEMFNKVRSKY